VLIAAKNAMVDIGGGRRKIRKGETTAHAASWIVRDKPHLWRPIELDFPADDPEPAAEPPVADEAVPEVSSATPDNPEAPEGDQAGAEPEPAAKDVRAWARAEGLDVPARGPLPDDIVARYKAATRDW
jgi:hypothetical protein